MLAAKKAAFERHVDIRILVEDGHDVEHAGAAPDQSAQCLVIASRSWSAMPTSFRPFLLLQTGHFPRSNWVHSAGLVDFENPAKSAPYAVYFSGALQAGSGRPGSRAGALTLPVSGAGIWIYFPPHLSSSGFAHWGGLR